MKMVTVSVKERETNRRAILLVMGEHRHQTSFREDLKAALEFPEQYDLRTVKVHDDMLMPLGATFDRPKIVKLEQLEDDFTVRVK